MLLRHLTVILGLLLLDGSPAVIRISGFNFSGPSNRILTPNGDGRNDKVVFLFENPQFSEVTGKIIDMRGATVATLATEPSIPDRSLVWDGRSNGQLVANGAYIYVIEAEGKTISGVVVVVR